MTTHCEVGALQRGGAQNMTKVHGERDVIIQAGQKRKPLSFLSLQNKCAHPPDHFDSSFTRINYMRLHACLHKQRNLVNEIKILLQYTLQLLRNICRFSTSYREWRLSDRLWNSFQARIDQKIICSQIQLLSKEAIIQNCRLDLYIAHKVICRIN